MTPLCHLLAVWLPTALLLLPATMELTRAHSLSHMTREGGSRMRRSVAASISNDTDAPHDVIHTPELNTPELNTPELPDSSNVSQPLGTFGGNEPHNDSHGGLPGNISTVTPPSVATGNASSVLIPAAAAISSSSSTSPPPVLDTSHTTGSPGAVHVSNNSTVTPESQSVLVEEHSTSGVPADLSSSSSPVPPVTSSINKTVDASTVSANATAAGGNATTVTATPGDNAGTMDTTQHMPTTNAPNATNTTSVAAVLPPDKVTEVTTTTTTTTITTTTKSSPVTPKRPECPVFTQPSPWQPGHSNNKSLVGNCLIAIATLAGLATFFMACSIVLCTRLSAAKQRYRFHMRRAGLGMGGDLDDGTEMVCISALMPDGDGPPLSPATTRTAPTAAPRRHRFPKSNGALIPVTADTDDSDGGDNLTLNSFLPDGDRAPCDGGDSRWGPCDADAM